MAVLDLVIYPDDRLLQRCPEVVDFTNIQQNIDDIRDSMMKYKGIGLAAIQVDIKKRIFVMDLSSVENKSNHFSSGFFYFINPVILDSSSDTSSYEEGCLSVPRQSAKITRPAIIDLEYQDATGKKYIQKGINDLAATCIQHEIDHLDGIIYPFRLTSITKKALMIEKAKKIKKSLE